jgi:hypothetical protein
MLKPCFASTDATRAFDDEAAGIEARAAKAMGRPDKH